MAEGASEPLGAPIRVGWASPSPHASPREYTARFHHFVNAYASLSQQNPFKIKKHPPEHS